MSFLQPIMLAGLPLVALPILIHLINRWRHRTLPWGAMMFLLDAKRLTRGMARLRFWLIMLTRMLAIAALLLALARPLASVWQGLAIGGRVETTIVLLDRSASMEQQDPGSRRSKRSAAISQLSAVLQSYGQGSRLVLIDSATNSPHEFESTGSLAERLETSATATSADLPKMLQAALDYIVVNETGRTDIWICSDLRVNDWDSHDGRWSSLRDKFQTLDTVKFYLLGYAEPSTDNVAVRVLDVRQRDVDDGRELVMDIELRREGEVTAETTLPCELTIGGTRSVVHVELAGDRYLLQGHKIRIDDHSSGGWGRVDIPADQNHHDNSFYFVFAESPVHHTTIVCENSQVADPLRIAATAPLDPSVTYTAATLPADRAAETGFSESSLILWQAQLPDEALARQLEGFVSGGRPVIFFPPAGGGKNSLFGCRWGEWHRTAGDQFKRVTTWRGDSDLLAHARSGEPLGLGELRTYAYRAIHSNAASSLARLDGGAPLLLRANSDGGAAYFCATLPLPDHSSLAQDGVAFYVSIQRALAMGAATQGTARQIDAGSPLARRVSEWLPADDPTRGLLLSDRWIKSGAYQQNERWLALNRPTGEDLAEVLDAHEVDRLFAGLDYRHVSQSIDRSGDLTSEIWRSVLVMMAIALIVEACLCLPDKRRPQSAQVAASGPETTWAGLSST